MQCMPVYTWHRFGTCLKFLSDRTEAFILELNELDRIDIQRDSSCLINFVCEVVPIFVRPLLITPNCYSVPEEYKAVDRHTIPPRCFDGQPAHISHTSPVEKWNYWVCCLMCVLHRRECRLSQWSVAVWLCEDSVWNGRFTYSCPFRQRVVTHHACILNAEWTDALSTCKLNLYPDTCIHNVRHL